MNKIMPQSLRRKVSSKLAFDVALFAGAVILIYKFGKPANDMIVDFVPSEASIRQQMAQ